MANNLQKNWNFICQDEKLVSSLSEEYKISKILAKTAINRFGEDAKSCFSGDKDVLHNPFLLNDMQKAVDRIKKAADNNEKIVVYGDYDVDGITSTYVLTDFLKNLGANVTYYIPDRADEGYGLSTKSLENLKQKGIGLIVTVDLGITAFEEAKYCNELGIDLIITDHHSLQDEKYPECIAVVNPKINSPYPFKNLAGVGVSFKVICAMCDNDKAIIDKYLPFVAIGTIADLVELKDENRYIAKMGISLIKNTDNIGLISLFEVSKVDINNTTSSNIGFSIGPRLNAAGRLSSANISVSLLMEEDKQKAVEIANMLDMENNRRKEEEQLILNEAIDIINDKKLYNNDVIVVSNENWHHGVIGIVASRITDLFYKPSIIISTDKSNYAKASGRSIKGFNLFDALQNSKDYLVKYGGHSLAAGLTIEKDKIEMFNNHINEYAKNIITKEILTPQIYIDDVMKISDISLSLINEFKILEPFGMGNRAPCFCIENVKIKNIKFSKEHSFITSSENENTITMPAFNMKSIVEKYFIDDIIDVCGSISINTYQGREYPQFIVNEIRPSHSGFLSKQAVTNIYMIIKSILSSQKIKTDKNEFLELMERKYKVKISINKLDALLKVLSELDLIDYQITDEIIKISEKPHFFKKTELEKSKTYVRYSCKKGNRQ